MLSALSGTPVSERKKEDFDFNISINCQVLCQSSRKEERYSTIYKLKRV
jgi:hypothetical protein